MVAVEATGYTDTPTARRSQVLDGWSVEKISRMGASAVKLLIYYHPDAKNASEQESLVREIAVQCNKYDLPFFLEPLSFSTDPEVKKLTSAQKRRVVVETAARLSPLGIDILKAEFPLETAGEPDERVWAEACRELNDASAVPWVLLSAGVTFDEFLRQTEIACKAGSSGVMAGRAVWQEAVDAREAARDSFLMGTGIDRMVQLGDVIAEHGTPWGERHPRKVGDIGEEWYIEY
jgi:tagatose-1,6-bisphosphate aldolase